MPLSSSVLVELGYARVQKERHEDNYNLFNVKNIVHARPEFPPRLYLGVVLN